MPICNIAQHSPTVINSNSGGVAVQPLVWFPNPLAFSKSDEDPVYTTLFSWQPYSPWKQVIPGCNSPQHPPSHPEQFSESSRGNSLPVYFEGLVLCPVAPYCCPHSAIQHNNNKLNWFSPTLSSENLFHDCLVLPRESLIMLQIFPNTDVLS